MSKHDRPAALTFASNQTGPRYPLLGVALVAALWAVVAMAGPARADERLRLLMEFAGGVLDVPMRGIDVPKIRYVSDEQMQLEYYGATLIAQQEGKDSSLLAISAYFNDSESTIVLNEDVDYSLPENEHILVHELVHYLQWTHGMHEKARCMQQLEAAAYRAQNLWVMASGYGEMTDKKVIVFNSHCPSRRPPMRR